MCTLISGITIRSSLHFPAMDAIFRDQITKKKSFSHKNWFWFWSYKVTSCKVAVTTWNKVTYKHPNRQTKNQTKGHRHFLSCLSQLKTKMHKKGIPQEILQKTKFKSMCFVNVQSSLHENIVLSVCALILERAVGFASRSAFGQSTCNDVSGHYKQHSFLFFYFLFLRCLLFS